MCALTNIQTLLLRTEIDVVHNTFRRYFLRDLFFCAENYCYERDNSKQWFLFNGVYLCV
jgi:hypothetical protein